MSKNIKCFSKDEIYNRFKLGLDLTELKLLKHLMKHLSCLLFFTSLQPYLFLFQ